MKIIRDLPIQRKMLVMTLLIRGAVLCVAITALFDFQVLNFRTNFQRDTAALADVIASNSQAPMTFKDDQAATEVVGALKAKPTVVGATLVLANGSNFRSLRKIRGRPEPATVSARLGKSLCGRRSARHPTWLEVDSHVGQGTTFRIDFPESPSPVERLEPLTDSTLRSGNETVLVAEDEYALRERVVQFLRMQGYTVLEAATGRDALAVWEKASTPID